MSDNIGFVVLPPVDTVASNPANRVTLAAGTPATPVFLAIQNPDPGEIVYIQSDDGSDLDLPIFGGGKVLIGPLANPSGLPFLYAASDVTCKVRPFVWNGSRDAQGLTLEGIAGLSGGGDTPDYTQSWQDGVSHIQAAQSDPLTAAPGSLAVDVSGAKTCDIIIDELVNITDFDLALWLEGGQTGAEAWMVSPDHDVSGETRPIAFRIDLARGYTKIFPQIVAITEGAGADAAKVWQIDDPGGTPGYTDITAAFNGGGSCNPWPASEDIGDQCAIGFASPPGKVEITLSTPGVGGTMKVKYWDGDSLEEVTGLTDGTTGLTSTGTITFTIPADIAPQVINGSDSLYWIYLEVLTVYGTNPVISDGIVFGTAIGWSYKLS